jgi:cystathionine beta-lyase/cystathionine gamma-synthase
LAQPLALGADLVLHRHLVPLCGAPDASISALVVADEQLAEWLTRTAEALGVLARAVVTAPSLLDGLGSLRLRVESARAALLSERPLPSHDSRRAAGVRPA